MERFFIASLLVGSVLGSLHGHMYRTQRLQIDESYITKTVYGTRDGLMGAVLYPALVPIATYQLVTKTSDTCIFSALFGPGPTKKSKTQAEARLE
jgi:hypothetical protein